MSDNKQDNISKDGSLPRIQRGVGSGMSAPSSRMTAPSVKGNKKKNLSRSASFKRTAGGTAATAATAASATVATVASTDLSGGSDHTAKSANRPTSTSSINFAKNFLDDNDPIISTTNSTTTNSATTVGGSGLQFDADSQRDVHRSLLSPASSTSPTDSPVPDKGTTTTTATATAAAAAVSAFSKLGAHVPGIFTGKSSSSVVAGTDETNVFKKAGREGFDSVDQSVNLMDAGAGQYESSSNDSNHRKRAKASTKTKDPNSRTSMVEIFLQDHSSHLGRMSDHSQSQHAKPQRYYGKSSAWEKCQDISAKLVVPLALCACVAIVILIAVTALAGDGNSGSAVDVPNTPSTPTLPSNGNFPTGMTQEMYSMSQKLIGLNIASPEVFEDLNAPTFHALKWVAKDQIALASLENDASRRQRRLGVTTKNTDRNLLGQDLDDHRIVQRYALAVIYYALGGNAQDSALTQQETSSALASAVNEMNLKPTSSSAGTGGALLSSASSEETTKGAVWLSVTSECAWRGINCHDNAEALTNFGEVTGPDHSVIHTLNLTEHGLVGSLPLEELTALSDLVLLDLRTNSISGNLKDDKNLFGRWKKMQYLLLGVNKLTGSIPDALSEMERLKDLDLAINKLSGELPSWSMTMENLENVYFENNTVIGSIPSKFLTQMPNLQYLDVSYNKLQSKVPADMTKLSHLRYWHADRNELTGELPKDISDLTRLQTLSFSGNKLTGKLDDELFSKMTRLVNLHLDHNSFSGNLPESLSAADRIEIIQLDRNYFSGTLPSSWFSADKPLYRLDLGHNKQLGGVLPTTIGSLGKTLNRLNLVECNFSGELPSELGQLSALQAAFLNGNKFSGKVPETLGNMAELENIRLMDNAFTGIIPDALCDLERQYHNDPNDALLIYADCETGKIECDCCHKCY